jgi:hypothetical protein
MYDLPKDPNDDDDTDDVLIEVHSSVVTEFVRFMKTYKLRSKIKIELMPDVRCSFFPSEDTVTAASGTKMPINTSDCKNGLFWIAVADPRTKPSLGSRALLNPSSSPPGNSCRSVLDSFVQLHEDSQSGFASYMPILMMLIFVDP